MDPESVIEQELTLLVRRAQKVTLSVGKPIQSVDRATYAILGRIHDNGPQRPGDLADYFSLDASTISRQVAALHAAGLIARQTDTDDRRASRLRLTDHGAAVFDQTRKERQKVLQHILCDWSETDLLAFATLLARFNLGLGQHLGLTANSNADQ